MKPIKCKVEIKLCKVVLVRAFSRVQKKWFRFPRRFIPKFVRNYYSQLPELGRLQIGSENHNKLTSQFPGRSNLQIQ